MKKLRLDLDRLQVHSFATGSGMALGGTTHTYPSECTVGCEPHAADPGTILLATCGRGTVGAHEARTTTDWCRYACPSWRCNHTTA